MKRERLVPLTFCVMAAAAIFPTLTQLHTTLPTGPTNVVTVPLFNAWTIWWNIDRAAHGFEGYWEAPIFSPAEGTFAFSEPQPATLIVAPVYWATGSLIVAFKVYLLMSLTLNGVFAYRLCRHLKIGRMWAFAAGAMMVWLPVSLRQLDVLQLIPVWGILWTWDAAWQHCRRPTFRSAVIAALACSVCFMMSVHHGLFMIIVLVPSLLFTMPWRRMVAGWKENAVAIALSAAIVGSLAIPMRTIMKTYQFERSQKLVTNLSAKPEQFLRLPPETLVGWPAKGVGFRLSPGWLKLSFACIGAIAGLCRRRKRRVVLFLLLMVVLATLLALGPNLKVGTWEPWWSIARVVPGLGQTRNVFRFAYLSQMAIILLSAIGLSEIWLRIHRRVRKPRLVTVLVTMLGAACVLELPPPNPVLAGVPDRSRHENWTEFVRQNLSPGKSIVCLPFSAGQRVTDFATTTRWMYYGTLHGAPMVNGYSGFFPKSYFAVQKAFNQTGLTDSVLTQFESADVELVIVQRGYLAREAIDNLPIRAHRLELVHADDVGIDIYRLFSASPQRTVGGATAEFVTSPLKWLMDNVVPNPVHKNRPE